MDYKLIFWTEFKRIFCYSTHLRSLAEKMVIPWKKYEELTSIAIDEMIEMIEKYYIELLLIDMDGTLKHYKEGLLECNKEWVNEIRNYVKIYIISNATENYTKEIADQLDLPYVASAKKQLSYSFKRVLKKENVEPNHSIVIGDAVMADILGAQRAGIDKTILLNDMNIERNKVKEFVKY